MLKRLLTLLLTLSILGPAALSADPAYYTKKGTWQATMQASREALSAWEAKQAGKAPVPTSTKPVLGPWHDIGPFRAGDAFKTAFGPEKEIVLTKAYGKLRWRRNKWQDGKVHQLRIPGSAAHYFFRTIKVSAPTALQTFYGSDDGLAVWINGKKVISNPVARGPAANQDRATLQLEAGVNHLLIKIWNKSGGSGWYFSTDAKGGGKIDPATMRRDGLWALVRRDFADPDARRQMDWEREDGIWTADWKPGEIKALAGRYVGPTKGTSKADEVQKRARSAQTEQDVAAIRSLYYRAKMAQMAMEQMKELNLRALRMAVEDLTRTYPKRYPKGPEYLRTLDQVEKALVDGGQGASADLAAKVVALQREALLANPLLKEFDELLLVKRSSRSPKLGLPQNWQGNCALPRSGYDNEIVAIKTSDWTGPARRVYKPAKPIFVGDVDLHWNGEKMMFSSIGENNRWQIFEVGADGRGLKQVTPGAYKDVDNYDPVYLPDDRILFGSTRCFHGVPCVGGGNQVANLFLFDPANDPKGEKIRQVTFEQDHDWCPTVMHNGRVMYTRWEYTDSPHYFTRLLFHMNPDGTQQMELYGSNSYWPNSLFYARPCPGHPTKFVGVISGHHGVPRMGELILFDPAQGRQEAKGVVQRIPGYGKKVEPRIADGLVNGSWPRFLHPWPLNDKYFLVSCQKTRSDSWDLYLVDVFDNMVLLRKEAGYAMLEPVPLKETERPPVVPDKVDPSRKDAIIYMADVYTGGGLADVPRGTVKAMRIYSYHYAYYRMGGHINIGIDGPWDVKRIIGTVPVREDGSAMFRVPANTPLAVQPLDKDGKALQIMRSWMTAMPGEILSCVGCHEKQSEGAPNGRTIASGRPPDEIAPWRGPTRGFGFTREVQPVLDKYCVSCHDGKAKGRPDFRVNGTAKWRNFTPSYVALHPYVRRPGPESDYHMMPPLEYHADASELVQMLQKGHGRVKLDAEAWDRLITWIDLNVPDKGTWSEHRKIAGNIHERRLAMYRKYAGIDYDPEKVVQPEPMKTAPVKPGPKPPRPTTPNLAGWPLTGEQAKLQQLTAAKAVAGGEVTRTLDLPGGSKLELVLVPAGSFVMGDAAGWPDEWPPSVVRIDKPFWIGTCEISNEQYAAFDPSHDSRYISHYNKDQSRRGVPAHGSTQPVIRVTWQQAMRFCQWLSRACGEKVSLPTEAQWEYACRAGTDTAMNYGPADADFAKLANFADKSIAALTRRDSPKWIPAISSVSDGATITASVGRYQPNAWGIHDMHGNVTEWTRTTYKPYPYRADDGRDDPATAGRKVARGGSFYDRPKRGRSAFRLRYQPWQRVFNVGFRVVVQVGDKRIAEAE